MGKATIRMSKQDEIDIVTTAIEGGIGYWSLCLQYDPEDGTALIRVMVPEDEAHYGKEYDISTRIILKGLRTLKDIAENQRAGLFDTLGRLLSGNYDANDADVCIQCALFGDVIYG